MSTAELTEVPRLGDKLANGATALSYRSVGDGFGVVLAFTEPDAYEPYVTWSYRERDGLTLSGHYFTRMLNAARDFERRS